MANGPGGVEEGRVSLRVVPDTSKFAADLRAKMAALRKEISLQIPVELDTRGLAEKAKAAVAVADKAAGDINVKMDVDRSSAKNVEIDLVKITKGISSSLGRILKNTSFAGLGVAAGAAIPNLIGLAGALTSVVGVVALIPALTAGAAASIGTLVLGFRGFGRAIADAGDPKAFAKDLKGLAPSAQAAAKAVKSLIPEFKALQQAVQQHLFAGLAADIKSTVTAVLPSLHTGLTKIADALALVFHNSSLAITQLAHSGTLSATFKNIAASLELAAPALGSFIQAFGKIALIGSTFLPPLVGNLQKAATSFRDFVDTPKGAQAVQSFIQGGITAFGQLFDIVKSLGSALSGVFHAAAAAGGTTLTSFASTLQVIADVINSPAFQTGLTQVFSGLLQGAHQLATALPTIGADLALVAPLISELAIAIGTSLAAAINAAGPALQTLLAALVPQLVQGLVTLLPKVVAGFQALAPVMLTVAQAIANNRLALAGFAVLIAALIGPFTTLAVIVLLVAANFQAISNFFTTSVLPVLQAIVVFLQPVIAAFQSLAQSAIGLGATVLPIFAQIFAVVAQNWPQIQAIIVQVMSTIQSIIVLVMNNIQRQIFVVTVAIKVIWAIFGNAILAVIRNVFPAMLTVIQGILNVIQGVVRAFTDLMKGNWSGLWRDLGQIAKGGIQLILGTFRTMGGLILGVIQGLGSTFISIGESIIQGIIHGIEGMASSLASSLKNTVTGALAGLGKHLGIGSPSRLFAQEIGIPISQGIALGISQGQPTINTALTAATAPPSVGTSTGTTTTGAGSLVTIQQVTVKDVDAMAAAIVAEQRDAAVVANLNAQLVG